ncbi:MAG TPA: ATP-binding protein [Rhizomicrobium sp.]|nr:ATP-binding protein [Rhizomicrobium sp.]
MISATPFRATAQITEALPLPILVVGEHLELLFANPAAEQFFRMGAGALLKARLDSVIPFASPLFGLVAQARERGASVAERGVDLATPRSGERVADVIATPLADPSGAVIVTLHEQSLAQRIDRQLLHRGAARSMSGLAAVLAHEIKNPLAGIRGAAQLLEDVVPDSEKTFTQLICAEADRVRNLIERMESFGDAGGFARRPVNIHEVLARARSVAAAGFARTVAFVESFDPSLPPVLGDFDRLVQVFLNLVRNAFDALPESGGEIALATGYRPGVRFGAAVAGSRVSLPLEVTVRDNGSGVAPELLPHIFDPFVTTKARGAGLGLALAAKIVGDHGGVIECESVPRHTVFRVLLPKAQDAAGDEQHG